MPNVHDLPAEISQIAYRNAFDLDLARSYKANIVALICAIEEHERQKQISKKATERVVETDPPKFSDRKKITIVCGIIGIMVIVWPLIFSNSNLEPTPKIAGIDGGSVQEFCVLQLAKVVVGRTGFPDEELCKLSDNQGKVLAYVKPADGVVTIPNLPLGLFQSDERWPLKIELSSKNHEMSSVMIDKKSCSYDGRVIDYNQRIEFYACKCLDVNLTVSWVVCCYTCPQTPSKNIFTHQIHR